VDALSFSQGHSADILRYSLKCVEGLFSEVWRTASELQCAAGMASLLLGSGPRLRHIHRSELLEDA
jgi:hypothetical protein